MGLAEFTPSSERHTPDEERRVQRLLIVEDETLLREALARRLARSGYCVASAASLQEAEGHLSNGGFDLFVFDVGLPDGDGLSLLDPCRAPKTLVISAVPPADHFSARGVHHFMPKPLDLSEVTRMMDRLAADESAV